MEKQEFINNSKLRKDYYLTKAWKKIKETGGQKVEVFGWSLRELRNQNGSTEEGNWRVFFGLWVFVVFKALFLFCSQNPDLQNREFSLQSAHHHRLLLLLPSHLLPFSFSLFLSSVWRERKREERNERGLRS